MTKSTKPSTPSGSSETQQRRRQITSYKNTTTSPATDSAGGRTRTEIGGARTIAGTTGSGLRPDGKCRNTVNPRDDGHRKRRSGPLGAVRPLWAQMEPPPD